MRVGEYGHTKLRLDDPRLPELVEAARESKARGELKLSALWLEEPATKSSSSGCWFSLDGTGEFKGQARARLDQHFAWCDGAFVASDRFVDLISTASLKGLSFLPLEEPPSPGRPVWRQVFAEKPIGRGLDHPLFDFNKRQSAMRDQDKQLPGRRWGVTVTWLKELRTDIEIRSPFIRDLILCRVPYFRIEGRKRFVQEFLPEPAVDFAYDGWGYRTDTGPGVEGRAIRSIVCNARARAALIDAGLVKPSMFAPLEIIAEADADAEVLDRIIPFPLPLPTYTPEEADVERTRRNVALTAANAPTPTSVFASTTEATRILADRLKNGSATWHPANTMPVYSTFEQSPLFARLPRSWKSLAPLLPFATPLQDRDNLSEFEMVQPEWNDWLLDEDDDGEVDPDEIPSNEDLIFGRTPYGDWYSVRASDPALPKDAQVTLWDHETLCIDEVWPSVAAFASHLISMCDNAAESEQRET